MSAAALSEIPTLYQTLKVAKNVLDRVSIWNGDITKIHVDAIVNAANGRLAGGGGVDGAIHRAAGRSELQVECRKYPGCDVGDAVITSGCGISHIKKIIHTVGPQIYGSVSEEKREKLISCYRKSLEVAKENDLKSIAFCCISTGVYGYPNEDAAKSVTKFLTEYLETDEELERIVLVTFLECDNQFYHEYFEKFAAKNQ
uniref:Macro domain-containing protein n=1 Tax=Caenorhabditis japonica TaxID=281687 RepID=A0A8R1DKG7_CAEJA